MFTMKNRRCSWDSLFWIAFGLLFCSGGIKYGLWKGRVPGPGFLPFISGSLLILLSIIVLVAGLVRSAHYYEEIAKGSFLSEPDSWKRVLIVSAAIIIYPLIVDKLGFSITTFLFTTTVLRLGQKSWLYTIAASGIVTLSFYVLFKVLLHVLLPPGFPGF
jgi:putative tricarboxylic transport membrane protein